LDRYGNCSQGKANYPCAAAEEGKQVAHGWESAELATDLWAFEDLGFVVA